MFATSTSCVVDEMTWSAMAAVVEGSFVYNRVGGEEEQKIDRLARLWLLLARVGMNLLRFDLN